MIDPQFIDNIGALLVPYTYMYIFATKYQWNCFTRVVSTINAIQCSYMVYTVFFNESGIGDILYIPREESINSLFFMSSYLFVDGLFQIPDLFKGFNVGVFTSIIHHCVGSFGIYLIAFERQGFFIGWYFAMTEISTPFLNFSWILHENKIHNIISKFVFLTFYIVFIMSRIATIPLLYYFEDLNYDSIILLSSLHYNMIYYGCYTLGCLNIMWTFFLTSKLVNIMTK